MTRLNLTASAFISAAVIGSVLYLSSPMPLGRAIAAGPDSRMLLSVPWGLEDADAGLGADLPKTHPLFEFHPEGPATVREAFGGRLLVVDTAMAKVKVFAPTAGGKFALEQLISWSPGFGPGVPLMIDAVQDSKGNFHVLDGASRGILLFDGNGVFKRHYGEFGAPQAICADRRGRVFVHDSGLGGVVVFGGLNNDWLGTAEGRHLRAVVDGNGNIYGLKEKGEEWWVTVISPPGENPLPEKTFAVCRKPADTLEVLGCELAGIDESGEAHIVFVQGRDGKIVATFDSRVGQGSQKADNIEIGAFLERRANLPRMYAVRADGSVLTFSDTETGFNVLSYGP